MGSNKIGVESSYTNFYEKIAGSEKKGVVVSVALK